MVKIFVDCSAIDLEQTINKWLTETNGEITVQTISYALDTSKEYFSALVYYVTSNKKLMKEALRNF